MHHFSVSLRGEMASTLITLLQRAVFVFVVTSFLTQSAYTGLSFVTWYIIVEAVIYILSACRRVRPGPGKMFALVDNHQIEIDRTPDQLVYVGVGERLTIIGLNGNTFSQERNRIWINGKEVVVAPPPHDLL